MSHSVPPSSSETPHQRHFSLGETTIHVSSPGHRQVRPKRWHPFLFVFGGCLLLGIVAFFALGARFTQALQFENKPISFFEGIRQVGQGLFALHTSVLGEDEGRINILLLGRAGDGKPGKHLTDTIMLLSVDTRTKKVALLSFPRDLLVPYPRTNQVAKINTLYQYGLAQGKSADLIKGSIEEIISLPVHYFASIDFDGFEQVIDALGGINVEVPRDIYDSRYPGPNYSYETFEIKKGWQKLDGKTALKYARVRHGDPEGDFGRAKRQQQIMQAVREKAWSIPTFLNPVTLTNLLESLGDSVTTDITPEIGRRLLEIGTTLDTKNINTVVLDAWKKESLLRVTHVEAGGMRAFALVPRSGTWDEVENIAQNIFNETNLEERRERILSEEASLLVMTPPSTLPAAESLKQDITELFPVKSVTLRVIPALEKEKETAIIQSRDGNKKIYTLDTLMGRYDLTRVETLDFTLPANLPETDFVLIYSRDIIPGLFHEAPTAGESEDFQEALPLLPPSSL